jgi:processive 1,2-diacylglycerol beta-glucosyltransferase
VFIATDYTCIPFTEETDCDYYVIPSEELTEEFVKRGIPRERKSDRWGYR